MNKHFFSWWLMTAILMTTFLLFYYQQAAEPFIFAGGQGSGLFTIGACSAPKGDVIFGWGNRAVGRGIVEFGCFDAAAGKIVGVGSLEECRTAVCR